jgi:hypothetical protein
MRINTQLLLAFLVIALISLGIISFLSYFNSKDAPNLRGQKPGAEGAC